MKWSVWLLTFFTFMYAACNLKCSLGAHEINTQATSLTPLPVLGCASQVLAVCGGAAIGHSGAVAGAGGRDPAAAARPSQGGSEEPRQAEEVGAEREVHELSRLGYCAG